MLVIDDPSPSSISPLTDVIKPLYYVSSIFSLVNSLISAACMLNSNKGVYFINMVASYAFIFNYSANSVAVIFLFDYLISIYPSLMRSSPISSKVNIYNTWS